MRPTGSWTTAVPSAIRLQERAGLDYVTDGEWRRESYVKVFADAVDGFMYDAHVEPGIDPASSIPYPSVVSRLKARRPIAAGEARFLKKHTDAKVMVAIPSPYTIGRRMWVAQQSSAAYPTREKFMKACIPIVRREVQRLVRLGVDAIQLDDPWLALLVDPDYRQREGITDIDHEKEMSVKCVNGVTEGIEGVLFSVHLCHAHFNRKHGTKGPYDAIMDALAPMNVHRFAMEFATPDAGGIGVLSRFPKDKMLGLGVIDHTDKNVESSRAGRGARRGCAGDAAHGAYLPQPRLRLLPFQHQSHGSGRGLPQAQGDVPGCEAAAREIWLGWLRRRSAHSAAIWQMRLQACALQRCVRRS